MKKRTAAIVVFLSLMPVVKPLLIGTGAVLTSAAVIFSVPEYAKGESASYYYNRGIDKFDAGDYYGAISDFNKAIEINPRYADAYVNRGVTKRRSGDNYGAISDYNKAIEINPNDEIPYNNRGNARAKLEDYSGAISDFNKAIEINPRYADAYYNRGKIKQDNLGDNYGAISDYNQSIEIDPNYSSNYRNRGIAKELIGDMKGACSDWEKASSLGDKDAAKWLREDC